MASAASAEWRRYGTLPLVAALGYATSVIHIYGFGPYFAPVAETFGWSRTEVALGLTVATLFQALFAIPVGMMVDRFGPRRLGVVGVVTASVAFGLLGTADGSQTQWLLLWLLMAVAVLPVQATIWTSAVATRFETSRGLAFAVTLCGASVAAAVFPLLGTWLIDMHGWQRAMAWQGAIWVAVTFLPILLFFRGARDGRTGSSVPAAARATEGMSLAEGLKTGAYWRLLIASLLFALTILALVVHFVPLLTGFGADPLNAAGIAALIGVFSLIGRLGAGLLLDRFPGSIVGGSIFLLPVLGCALLLGGGDQVAMQAAAAALIGLTLGAEVDVIAYLTTRYFGLASFGSLFGGMLVALSIGTAIGPVAAAAVFDETGTYTAFLWLTILAMSACATALFSLPRQPAPASSTA